MENKPSHFPNSILPWRQHFSQPWQTVALMFLILRFGAGNALPELKGD
jgi:hypothetical protein